MNKSLKDQKLELEIQALKKPWFKKPEFLGISINLFIGIATAGILYFNGAFDFKNLELKIEREKLEQDISKFTNQKELLNKSNKELTLQVQMLYAKIMKSKNDSTALSASLNDLKSTVSIIEKGKYSKQRLLLDLIKKTNYYRRQVDSLIPYSHLLEYYHSRPDYYAEVQVTFPKGIDYDAVEEIRFTDVGGFMGWPLVFKVQMQSGADGYVKLNPNNRYDVSIIDKKYKVKGNKIRIDLGALDSLNKPISIPVVLK